MLFCSDIIKGQVAAVPIENSLSLLVVPRVTNIHLSPAALMNEVTRRNKGFLWVHATPVLFCLNRYNRIINATKCTLHWHNTWLASNRQWELVADENWDCQHLCKENVNQVAFFREVMGEKVHK